MAEGPYWGWSMLGGGGLLDSNLGGVTKSMAVDQAAQSSGGSGAAVTTQATRQSNYAQQTTAQAASSPAPGSRWQGGEANPGGTQDQYGRQTGGRYVDPTYQHDSTGRALSPEEQAYRRDQDRKRAEAGSIARSANYGGGTPTPSIDGIDYDNQTGKWKYWDKTANDWLESDSVANIYNTLFSTEQKSQHPLSYYENIATNQDKSAENDRLNRYRQAQNDAFASTPTTRYQPVRF